MYFYCADSWFRPTQSKSKKDNKLESFGFDDGEALSEEDDLAFPGGSNYKIKYFGFDDLSESDSDEDESSAERRRVKRRAMSAAVPAKVPIETSVDRPQPRSSQESQSSSTGQRLGLMRGQYKLCIHRHARSQWTVVLAFKHCGEIMLFILSFYN